MKKAGMKIQIGLTMKLALFVIGGTALVYGLALAFNSHSSRQLVEQCIRSDVKSLTLATVARIERELEALESVTAYAAQLVERTPQDEGSLEFLCRSALETDSDIYGFAVAYRPDGYAEGQRWFAPYYSWGDGQIERVLLQPPLLDYFQRPWYHVPRDTGESFWTEPYESAVGEGILMSTYAVPFYEEREGQRRFAGVVAADMLLAWLRDIVGQVQVMQSGYAFLVSRNGHFLTHPDSTRVLNDSIIETAKRLESKELQAAAEDMLAGGEQFVRLPGTRGQERYCLYYAPLKSTGWTLAVRFPEKELFAGLRRLDRHLLAIGGAGFLLLACLGVLLGRYFTRPLRQIARMAGLIAKGLIREAQGELPALERMAGHSTTREYTELARAFISMTTDLTSLLMQVRDCALQVSSSATQIAASAKMLRQNGESQAVSLSEVSATSRSISEAAEQIAGRMTRLSGDAASAAESAHAGSTSLERIAGTHEEMLTAVELFVEKLNLIHAKTDDIGQIITTITKVANQTNLLSLNAAIEAEKAGEHGRGFSVVARQIRALADQTGVAVLNIEELVLTMQAAVSDGVSSMQHVRKQLDTGVHEVESFSESVSGLIDQAQRLGPEFEDTNSSMHAQAESAVQISQTIEFIKQSAVQTRDALDEFMQTTEQLQQTAEYLNNEMRHFSE
jgi:methyl-accepting chemotaxis protein